MTPDSRFLWLIRKFAHSAITGLLFPLVPGSQKSDDMKSRIFRYMQPANFEIAERAKFHELQ